jgi:hypothetical protein
MPKMMFIVVCAAMGVATAFAGRTQAPAGGRQESNSQVHPEADPAPPRPIAEQKAELGNDHAWNPEWDRMVKEALPSEMLSDKRERAVRSLCPRFKEASIEERRTFWAYFFQALAGAEAGLEPTISVRHSQPEVAVVDLVTHRVARQEGLLQLAYMESERYGCNFDWEKDKELAERDPAKTILQPKNNLECGIKILDSQLIAKSKPLLSKSSYWVTLRPGQASFQIFMKQMVNVPAFCGAKFARQTPTGHDVEPAVQPETTNKAVPAGRPEAENKPAVAGTPAVAAH